MPIAFVVASLLLAVTPGPGVVYVVARTSAQGRRAGLASVAGVALGNLTNAIGAALGLEALFAVSASAFTAVKLGGAAYLVWLGARALLQADRQDAPPVFDAPDLARIARDGFIVALLNPKTALFFAAFLPQFMNTSSAAASQAMLLAGVFVLIAAVTDSAYVALAGIVGSWLGAGTAARRAARRASGWTFIGLGIAAALSGSRVSR